MMNFAKKFLNLLFPQRCLGCKKEDEILCFSCLNKISYPKASKIKDIFIAGDYHDPALRKAIWLFKYKGSTQLKKPLGEIIKKRIWEKFDAQTRNWPIIPIPLSAQKSRKRGFNQTELVAREISSNILTNALAKKAQSKSQVEVKDRKERLKNAQGSFRIKDRLSIRGRNIILLDDVYTTGATIREARKVLKKAGAKKVIGIVLAAG
ncbi:ComF family protein [Candidatus Parcubacteria bacterium]|nr:MAG: ComF family protein [Candidatus Parcubacteria bacterium]